MRWRRHGSLWCVFFCKGISKTVYVLALSTILIEMWYLIQQQRQLHAICLLTCGLNWTIVSMCWKNLVITNVFMKHVRWICVNAIYTRYDSFFYYLVLNNKMVSVLRMRVLVTKILTGNYLTVIVLNAYKHNRLSKDKNRKETKIRDNEVILI